MVREARNPHRVVPGLLLLEHQVCSSFTVAGRPGADGLLAGVLDKTQF
jgi:hypothetical protein